MDLPGVHPGSLTIIKLLTRMTQFGNPCKEIYLNDLAQTLTSRASVQFKPLNDTYSPTASKMAHFMALIELTQLFIDGEYCNWHRSAWLHHMSIDLSKV